MTTGLDVVLDEPVDTNEITLRRVELPLVNPWTSARDSFSLRPTIIVEVRAEQHVGYGESPALRDPNYVAETHERSWNFLVDNAPLLLSDGDAQTPRNLVATLTGSEHNMAVCALETALIDISLKRHERSLAQAIATEHAPQSRAGVTPTNVAAGVVRDGHTELSTLVDQIHADVETGYCMVKLKISPTVDIETLRVVCATFPAVAIGADANGTLRPEDPGTQELLRALDRCGLAFLEQPFNTTAHRATKDATREFTMPIALDESITSPARLRERIDDHSLSIATIKAPIVGGIGPALACLNLCATHEIGARIGGLIESGVGRAANIGLATHPAITQTGDISESSRFFASDVVVDPATIANGAISVPTKPGIGANVSTELLDACTVEHMTLNASY